MNFYAVLDESDSDNEKPTKTSQPKGKKTPSATAAAPKKEVTATSASTAKTGKPVKDTEKAKPVTTTKAPAANDESEITGKDNIRGGRPRGKGDYRHGGRGSRGAEEGDKRGKREFDRKSGTGRGREVSRGGRGPYGAGNPQQEAQDAEKHPDEALDEAQPEMEGDVEPEEEVEPEPATLTLDEFMKQREAARAKAAELLGQTKTPLAANTEVIGQKAVKEEVDYIPGKQVKSEASRKESQRSNGKTQIINVGFKFESTQPSRDYRERERPSSGRGSGRGGRGRGGRSDGSGRSGRGPKPTALSSSDFPSL